jgi:hypothetical protein
MSAQEPAILGYLPAIPQAAAEYFGTKPSLTRNFAKVTDTKDVLWDVNNASIRIENNSNITIQSANNSVITSTKNLTLTGSDIKIQSSNNSEITSTKNLTLSGSSGLTFSDSKNSTTLDALLLRIKTIENRLNAPTKTLVPNTSIMAITNI